VPPGRAGAVTAAPAIVPPRVRRGDTVAVVSPSWPAVGLFPRRVARARAYLEGLGLRVRIMPNAAGVDGWVSGTPQHRAADIHDAFRDDAVRVVLAGIGGNHSNAILPHLDYDLIRTHPKVFQGYSDVTVLHWALARRAGLRTFHGPSLVAELGEHGGPLPFTDRAMRAAWFGDEALAFEPADDWTEEFLDWETGADDRPRAMRPGGGWTTIRAGRAEGWLLGGCLETVCWHLKGSSSWLDPTGAILVLETSEEAPQPAAVDSYLTDLEQLGVFDGAAGLVIGRPYGYDDDARETLWRVVEERTRDAAIPVLGDVDCGHTDPMLTLPIGARAVLDAGVRTFATMEPATR
jgi:muramoyltetrapeptide carboxypeptidase